MRALAGLMLCVACGSGAGSGHSASEVGGAAPEVSGAAGVAGAAAPARSEKNGWGDLRPTQSSYYRVALAVSPEPPALGEFFDVVVTVKDRDGVAIEDAKVTVNARMPQHNHGMETEPVPVPGDCAAGPRCRFAGGEYRSKGFKFHMGGQWTITVDVEGPEGTDNASFVYDMR
jgi:hypothetical protein